MRCLAAQELIAHCPHAIDASLQVLLDLPHTLKRVLEHLDAMTKIGAGRFDSKEPRRKVLDGRFDLMLQDLQELLSMRLRIDRCMVQGSQELPVNSGVNRSGKILRLRRCGRRQGVAAGDAFVAAGRGSAAACAASACASPFKALSQLGRSCKTCR